MATGPPLGPNARQQASRKFYRIVDRFDNVVDIGGGYRRSRLVRLTYDYALSPVSQDNFLRAFFRSLELSTGNEDDNGTDIDLDEQVQLKVFGFADYLFNNFFLPIKASARKTPQPSPAFHSAIQRLQGGGEFAETPERLSALRGACLVRDRHRCVVSRSFNRSEFNLRQNRDGDSARDDDGVLLLDDPISYFHLEVAHILPHSLTRLRKDSELDAPTQAALAILNMFDDGVGRLIEGRDIDRPRNALTLSIDIHQGFGNFEIFFEPASAAGPHTYQIQAFRPQAFRHMLPVTRTLYLTENRTIDPPSPRRLAIHRAIGHILHLSAAGSYIDKILRDMEDSQGQGVQADGSTDLARLVHLGLWLDGAIDAY